MGSKTLTLATNAETGVVTIAGQAEATLSDVFTTIPQQDKVVTGGYGLLQRLAIFEAGNIVGGMMNGAGFMKAASFGLVGE